MAQPHKPWTASAPPPGSKFESALAEVAQAREYALDTQRDIWEFAVEISSLMDMGLTRSDLRWLVSKGYLEHAHEVTRSYSTSRCFERVNNLVFRPTTCFVLVESWRRDPSDEQTAAPVPPSPTDDSALRNRDRGRPFPHWDVELRELRVGQKVVKRFRSSAPNQEAVLAAFQEEGWPPAVYDPLPGSSQVDSKRRLHDTIKLLNRSQENDWIVFRGDGTGERILWEEAQCELPAAAQASRIVPAAKPGSSPERPGPFPKASVFSLRQQPVC